MSIIKEFRDFFLRNVQKPSGIKQDQEIGFPVDYQVGNTIVKNRFLKNHYPNENVFKKLFNSITFKLEKDDTAKETEQGLVKKATDLQAKNNDNGTDGFTKTVIPSQLPTIDDINNLELDDFDIAQIPSNPNSILDIVIDNTINTRNHYTVQVKYSFLFWLKQSFNKIKDYIDTINILNGEVTYSNVLIEQNKVNITSNPETGNHTKSFKVDVVLPPIPTIDVNDIVNTVINQINTTSILNILDLLPIGFTTDITDQMILLNNFNLTTGLGLPSTNYSKWAICGIASGTIDLKGRTLRYLDTTVLDYDTINKVGGFDNYTLTKDNIPAHRHTFSFLHRDRGGNYQAWETIHENATGGKTTTDADLVPPIRNTTSIDSGSADSNDTQFWVGGGNTGNGSENILAQDTIKVNPDAFNLINKYRVVAKIVKII